MADGEIVVSAFLKGLSERLAAATAGGSEGLQVARGINRDMKRLSTIIQAILPLVEQVEDTVEDDAMTGWLREIEDAATISDDILKRIAGRCQDGGAQITRDKYLSCIFHCRSTGSESHHLDIPEMALELKAIVKRLDLIAIQRGVASGSNSQLDIRKEISAWLARWSMGARIRMLLGVFRWPTPDYKCIFIGDQSGDWLRELENAIELRIAGVNNVRSGEEAAKAQLIKRKNIKRLVLEWDRDYHWDGRPRGLDDEVLERLQPHRHLKELILRNHYGTKFPSWIENQWLSKLETLKMRSCLTWDFAPLGKLPFLKYLTVCGAPWDIQRSANLHFNGTQGWDGRGGEDDPQPFPNLRILKVKNFFYLHELPLLPPTLVELSIEIVPLTVLPGLWGCDGVMRGENESFSPCSLSYVKIVSCHNLTSLGEGLLEHHLPALGTLTISCCERLRSFPDNGLQSLVSLKSLTIIGCNKLTWSPENGSCLPSSLMTLQIIRCRSLCVDSFFSGLQNLTSLSSLVIEGERFGGDPLLLESLQGEWLYPLTALTELKISHCAKLQMFGFQALPSLRRLKIDACKNLHSPPSFEGWGPPPLEYLEINDNDLQFLTYELLQNLTSLQELRINSSFLDGEVQSRLCCLTSLQTLYIHRCDTPETLADEFESFAMLEELYITDCHSLESLPEKGFPDSLMILCISRCSLSVEQCKEGGPDWFKIAHIPYVEINERQVETEAWAALKK